MFVFMDDTCILWCIRVKPKAVQQQCLYSELFLYARLILGRILNSEHSLIDFFVLLLI